MKKDLLCLDGLRVEVCERLFIGWLFHTGFYSSFYDCHRAKNPASDIRTLVDFVTSNKGLTFFDIVEAAFPWSKTPQGRDFWYKASNDWKNYLNRFFKFLS